METIAALWTAIVTAYLMFIARRPRRVDVAKLHIEGMRIESVERSITTGLASTDQLKVQYTVIEENPIAVSVSGLASHQPVPAYCLTESASGQSETVVPSGNFRCNRMLVVLKTLTARSANLTSKLAHHHSNDSPAC